GQASLLNSLSLGFVADVAMLANRRFKPLGAASYALAVVLCLANFKKQVYNIKLDGVEDPDPPRTALLIFNNSKFTGGHMMLAPKADTGDGQIDIVRWSSGRSGFTLTS